MVNAGEIQDYLNKLPESMSLKKMVLKYIMKSESPLTQKDIKEGLKQKDWTNIRRILNELVENGIIVKTRIGIKDYYIKIGKRKNSEILEYQDEHKNNITLFIDLFEPDIEGAEKKIRIKQARQIDLDNYEVIGKLNLPIGKIDDMINKLNKIKN